MSASQSQADEKDMLGFVSGTNTKALHLLLTLEIPTTSCVQNAIPYLNL